MPLSRRYVTSCASNKASMRSTLFNSRIIELCQREGNLGRVRRSSPEVPGPALVDFDGAANDFFGERIFLQNNHIRFRILCVLCDFVANLVF
jgi:hypothetical protein